MGGFDPISYHLAKRALRRALQTLSWEEVKQKFAEEGAVNKVYDPDLDGALGTVTVEALKVPNSEKIYFGTDNRYSLRFDPSMSAFVIRDEVKGEDILVIKA